MSRLIITTILFITVSIIGFVFFRKEFFTAKNNSDNNISKNDMVFYLVLISITAMIMKIVGSLFYYERGDMGAFISWMNNLQKNGFAGFYTKYGLCYPPLHIFIVYIIGIICSVFNIGNFSILQIVLIKSPALICDLLTSFVLYKTGRKYHSEKCGLALFVFYTLNPAVIFNSSVWGQMDSIYTLCIVIMCYLIAERKLKAAYFAFAASILFKYQGVIFAPIIICAVLDQVILDNCTTKKFFSNLFTGIGAIASMVLCHLPFIFGNGNAAGNTSTITSAYGEALTAYRYASVNAYNIWAMFGLNWHTQEDTFLSLTYNNWGTIAIVLIVIVSIVISLRAKHSLTKYYSIAAFIISTMFMFSVRMHERYLFPALPLIIAAYVAKPTLEFFIAYVGLTLMNLYNCAHVLFYYNPYAYDPKALPIVLTSFGTLVFWIVFMIGFVRKYGICYKANTES